jgi:hypothetical protein
MLPRSPALFVVLLLLGGCLEPGPLPAGVHLFHSQTLTAPGFIEVGGERMIRFRNRTAHATASKGGVSDLWISSFDGTRQRKVVANWSDYWGGEQGPFNAGDRYFMVDERLATSEGGMARVATLVRLGPTMEEEFRLDGIWVWSRFTVPLATLFAEPPPGQTCPGFPKLASDCPQILYERPAQPGQKFPTLYLWNGEQDLVIGADAGSFQNQVMGNGTIYAILGETRTLTRLSRPASLVEALRANVTRFSISGDEHYAALAISEDGKAKTVVRNLQTGAELDLARPNPSAWGGFGDGVFAYAQNATATEPAELHVLDLATGEDKFETLPAPLVNLAGVLYRPESDERLLLDSLGQGVFTGNDDLVARRTMAGPLLVPSFTKDGSYLIHIAPAAATLYDTTPKGALMFQDAELTSPASMISPPGLLVSADRQDYFFADDDGGQVLVFWARLGRASSDLYFADYAPGTRTLPTNLRLIARAILSVSISTHTLFGIIDMSQQDGVGDLILRDIDQGTDILYSHAVAEAAELGGPDLASSYAAYTVRGRADSDRSGLWLTSLAPPTPPDGGTD